MAYLATGRWLKQTHSNEGTSVAPGSVRQVRWTVSFNEQVLCHRLVKYLRVVVRFCAMFVVLLSKPETREIYLKEKKLMCEGIAILKKPPVSEVDVQWKQIFFSILMTLLGIKIMFCLSVSTLLNQGFRAWFTLNSCLTKHKLY